MRYVFQDLCHFQVDTCYQEIKLHKKWHSISGHIYVVNEGLEKGKETQPYIWFRELTLWNRKKCLQGKSVTLYNQLLMSAWLQ